MSRSISFVLPVTLHETGSAWRASASNCTLPRAALLLRSFVSMFHQDDLAEFFLIAPARDAPVLSSTLRSITHDSRYRLISELEVCPNLGTAIDPETNAVRGWRVQQLIKLAMHARVSSEYYVTLDSDVVCLRPCSYDDLVKDGLAVTNCESATDYARIYTDEFAARETEIKRRRYRRSGEILGRHLQGPRAQFYGETPAVLRANAVSGLLAFLSRRSGRQWSDFLARKGGWTEYGLYYNFLEMTGQLDACCYLAGCNSVLDLERSVWQASEHYRQARSYDVGHFMPAGISGLGLFAAIQSWLPVSSWLPPRYRTVGDFYQELEGWLGVRDSLSSTMDPQAREGAGSCRQ